MASDARHSTTSSAFPKATIKMGIGSNDTDLETWDATLATLVSPPNSLAGRRRNPTRRVLRDTQPAFTAILIRSHKAALAEVSRFAAASMIFAVAKTIDIACVRGERSGENGCRPRLFSRRAICEQCRATMFLRQKIRKKDGKRHRYFSVVENKRVAGGRVVQKHVLHLGEINDSQELAWRRSIEVLDEEADRPKTLALFPEDRCEGIVPDDSIVRLKLSQLRLCRPRQWSAFRPAARARVGIRNFSCWSPIACWRRAASGDCIGSGLNGRRWPIC